MPRSSPLFSQLCGAVCLARFVSFAVACVFLEVCNDLYVIQVEHNWRHWATLLDTTMQSQSARFIALPTNFVRSQLL